MPPDRLRSWPRLVACVFVLAGLGSSQGSADDGPAVETLVLTGATIYPSPTGAPIVDGVVVVRAGRIAGVGPRNALRVPEDATGVNCDGMHLVAGFQNSHVHFTEPKWEGASESPAAELAGLLEAMLLRYGFTTVVDTGSALSQTSALRARIESGEVRGPRILTAGTPLYPEDGIPFYLKESLPPAVLARLHTPKTAPEAAAVVAGQVEAGADAVKLFTGSWVARGRVLPMPVEIARAAAQEAHRRGKPVFAHASNIQGLEVALAAGVDVLAHALDDDRGWKPSHVERMRAGRMVMIPTLKLFGGQPYTKFIQQEVRDYTSGGGQVLFGTDVGFLSDYDPREEYRLMAGSGLDWRQVLASLTTAPAELFGEGGRRGQVAPGMDADIVVLSSDPTSDVTAFAEVVYVLRRGRIVYQRPDRERPQGTEHTRP